MCAGLAADRAGGNRGVNAEREPAVGNALDALSCLEHQDEICRLGANLKAETASGEGDEARIAPGAVFLPDGEDTFATARTDAETNLDNIRYDGNGEGAR